MPFPKSVNPILHHPLPTFVAKRFETFASYDKEEKQLVTSLTRGQCINATRYYLKLQQENLLNNVGVAYTSTVDGKL